MVTFQSPHDTPTRRRPFIQALAPTSGVIVGDLWVDLTASLVKRCTSISPITFVSIEGGGGGTGALTRAGGNTTEATTTSTVTVDILTVSGLSIAVGTPVLVMATYRKTTGAADQVRLGLKLNTTEVRGELLASSAVDQAESMLFTAWFVYGVSNYLRSGYVNVGKNSEGNFNADMPTATLTDVVIIGSCDNALITLGVDECHVYTFAVS